MRFAMLVAAAVAAVGVVVPAGAQVSGELIPLTGTTQITGGYTQDCASYYVPASCVYGPPALDRAYTPSFTVPDLNGTYTFTDSIGPSSNAGVFSIYGTLAFSNGALTSSYYEFIFNQTKIDNSTGSSHTRQVSGNVTNASAVVNLNGVQVTLVPVPEPATWAMMVAGFGLVGFALRSRRVTARPLRAL